MLVLFWELAERRCSMVLVLAIKDQLGLDFPSIFEIDTFPGFIAKTWDPEIQLKDLAILRIILTHEFIWLGLHWEGLSCPADYILLSALHHPHISPFFVLFIPATPEDWNEHVEGSKLTKHTVNNLPAAQFGSESTA
ncbi:hypothetical protein N7535_004170 [Penicillium sp. DV-2018c]|nr:hypothetical protein N7535_004170 [Penicillium sp. DV-2018c]